MTIRFSGEIEWPALERIRQSLHDELDKVVRRAAFRVELSAKQLSPVDTGALRASIYTVTSKGSGRAAALSQATRPRVSANDPGQVSVAAAAGDHPRLRTDIPAAMVVVGVEYGPYVNFGTRTNPANGYLTKAMWRERSKFRSEVAAVLSAEKWQR